MSETDSKPELKMESETNIGSGADLVHKPDSEPSHDESMARPADGHDNKGFHFGEDPYDPNNRTNTRFYSNMSGQSATRLEPPSSSTGPPAYHPSTTNKATDAYTPSSNHTSVPHPSTARQSHRFEPTTNGTEPSLHNNNISTISHTNGRTVNGLHNVDIVLNEDQSAMPYRTEKDKKPKDRSVCATLGLICCIFFFLFLFLAVGVFAAVYFTILFPDSSRGDVNKDEPTTISPTISFPPVEEISVDVTMTLNQTYQIAYNNILSTEYQEFVDSFTQAMDSTFSNSELMDVYVRTDAQTISSGSIVVNSIIYLDDVPPGLQSNSQPNNSPVEQIRSHTQTLVLATLQDAAETDNSALSSLDVHSNSIIVDTPEVTIAVPTTPPTTTQALQPASTKLTVTQKVTTNLKTTQSLPTTSIRQSTVSTTQSATQSATSTTQTLTQTTAPLPTTEYQDTEPPVVTCPADIDQFSDPGQPSAIVTWNLATATDNSGSVASLTSDFNSGSPFAIGDTAVTYTATDETGNTGNCTFQITVIDNEPPLLLCPSTVRTETDPGEHFATGVTWDNVFATDNSRFVFPAEGSHDETSMFLVGPTAVIYTALDPSGNRGNCSFFVIVEDKEGPQLTCPEDIVQSTDQDLDSTTVTWNEPIIDDNNLGQVTLESNFDTGSSFVIGQYVVVYMATDEAGNQGQCSFVITVEDTQVPVLTCPDDQPVANDLGLNTAVVIWSSVTVVDNSGANLVPFSDHPSGSTFPLGSTDVTYSVTDASGNTGTCTFSVSVLDNEPPTITCPPDMTVLNDPGLATAIATWTEPTASDNSQSDVTLATSTPSGSTFVIGGTTVRYVATDESGYSAECTFKVTVEDVEKPVIHCPANQTASADPGQMTTVVTWPEVMEEDNQGIQLSGNNPQPGSRYPVGETQVIYWAVDWAGLGSQCIFWVIVEDNEAPTVTCPADITAYVVIGVTEHSVYWDEPSASDNVAVQGAATCEFQNGTTFSIGMHTVECSATDIYGNVGSCQFGVHVTEPVVQASGSLTLVGIFTPSLLDPNSEDYMELEQRVVASMDQVFQSGSESNSYAKTTLTGFREGSVIADLKVGFKRSVEQDDLTTFMSDSINTAIIDGTMGGVDAVPNSAEFNDVIVPTPESGLKFDCTDQDSTIPSMSIVSIQYRYGHGCTGVLITQQHVLTAASCEAFGGTFVNILAGSETLSGQEVTAVEAMVHKIHQHPGFNALTGENNLAVMELEMALPTSIAQAACLDYLALGTIDFSVYQDCFIWGWGTLSGGQFQSLQSTSVSTLSNDVPGNSCDTYTYPFVMTKNKFCASGASGSSQLCTADTGSPLMCKNQQNGWSLVGLSNGYTYNNCALGMYTLVSQHWEFISSVVDNGGVSVPCDVIEAPSCAATLNYFSTFATTQSSYETTMQTLSLILTCHPDAQTFFCSALLPECELNNGLVPCRSFCDDVLQSCYAQYEALFGEGSWPIYCTDYPLGADANALLCEKGSYPTCGETNLQVTTAEPLTLTSPNYPNPYPDQHDCTWFIEGPEGLNLLAKFKDLGVEECCDTMTIGYGSDPTDRSSVVGQYYGETLISGFEVILSQKMWVRLQSDFATGMQGFSLEIYAIDSINDFCNQPYAFKCAGTTLCIPSRWRCDQVSDCSDGSDEASCPDIEQVVIPGLESRTILSPGYPVGYFSDTNQIWVITTDPGKQLHLMFMTFETEKDFDVVRIGQGDDPFVSESWFFEWSGNKIPPPIRSSGDAVWVQLMADDSLFKDGFELTVTSVEAADPILCRENQFDCGGGVCIPSGAKCDNITDCIFGRDEYGCYGLRTCSPAEFSCGDGQCIPLSLICDGSPECGDNSDEIGCPTRAASTPTPIQTMAPTEPPKPDCNSDLCYNGAQCEDIADTFFCLCTPGYQGTLCDQEINECLPNPCKNSGSCTDGLNSYSCQCVIGFIGENCETNINDCVTNPCQSGGSCVDGINGFTCDCPLGYGGDTCEIEPCSSIDSTTCIGLLPYDTTVFPNDHATSSQDALNKLTNLASVLNCHPDAQLLHCTALFPQCPWPNYGKATTPCRSVCVDVTSACASIYESTFNEPWPFDCDTYVTGSGTFCEQAEGDVFGTGLCGTRPEASVTSRIIGGENSLPGSWPWIGSLRESFGDHQCGATLINDRWAITAAHCVGVFHAIVFGDTQLNKPSPNSKAYRFLKIFPHPDYDKTMFDEENDLAMLYLPERVDFTGFVLPSCLTTIEEETLAYRDCHVIGWGHTMEDGYTSNKLQEVMLPLLSPEGCREKLGPRTVSDNMICAGQPQGGLDSCQGDSGGPLVCLGNDDVWHLVGVTSFGFGCGRPHTPGVYVRVSQYVDWIENTIKETEESVQQVSVELNVSQRIESPNFPQPYPSNAFVEWSFTSPPGTQIILTIISHSTETAYDYVNFGHGHDTGDMDTLIETLEGEIDLRIKKRSYSTDSNIMWMYFVSDYSVVQAGFQFDITAINPGDMVRCGDGERVVPPSWVCDTVADCSNGSDEQGCQ